MTRRFFCVFSAILLASGFTACTYDDGGVENQNGNNGTAEDSSVICSTKCPEGYFCDGKTKGCEVVYDSGSACQDNVMCKSGLCLNNVCGCLLPEDCPDGQTCEANACVMSTGPAGLKGGEACTADSECLTKKCNAGFCGCSKVSDCMANHVCDAGVCRKVDFCPNNGSKSCFSALELYPPENSWNIGKITPSGKDYAGSTFDLYLPQYNVVTCSYPLAVRSVLFPIIRELGANVPDNDPYCQNHAEECALRNTAGCYMVEMDKQTPFTFVLKEGSQWKGHNFYVDYKLSESGIEALNNTSESEKYSMYIIPQYGLQKGEHIGGKPNNLTAFILGGAKPIENKDFIVRYDVSKCTSDNFHYEQVASDENVARANGIIACETAYQIMVETTPRSGGMVGIDSALKECSADVTIGDTEFKCNGVCSGEIDGNTTYHIASALHSTDVSKVTAATKYEMLKGLMYVKGNVDISKKPEDRCFSVIENGTTKYKYDESVEQELEAEAAGCFLYGYPGPVDKEVTIWRSCRTGKILVNEISVLVEVSDDEIAK